MYFQDFGLYNFSCYAFIWNNIPNKIIITGRESCNLMKGKEKTQQLKISEIFYISSLLSNSIHQHHIILPTLVRGPSIHWSIQPFPCNQLSAHQILTCHCVPSADAGTRGMQCGTMLMWFLPS